MLEIINKDKYLENYVRDRSYNTYSIASEFREVKNLTPTKTGRFQMRMMNANVSIERL